MRFALALFVMALVVPAAGHAGLNRTFMVPAYDDCPGSQNCNPPTRSSSYTFDSIVLYSSPQPYIVANKLSLRLVVKGLRDSAGRPVTGTVVLKSGQSRVTIVGLLGTIGDRSPLTAETPYSLQVTNGNGAKTFLAPAATPAHGLITNSITPPVLYDPAGQPLATTGARSRP
jgi:hypothetical protein